MVRIKRGGRELTVADADLTGYLEQGYSVIDAKGNELTRAKAVTYEQAVAENADLRKKAKEYAAAMQAAHTRIGELEAENARLQEALTGKDAPEESAKGKVKNKAAQKQADQDAKAAEAAEGAERKPTE